MSNNISVFGSLGKDPELKFSSNGNPILKFSLADNVGFGDKKNTNWYNVVSFRKGVDKLSEFLRKGSKVVVYGELRVTKTTSDAGVKYTNVDIVANDIVMAQNKLESTHQPLEGPGDSDDSETIPF